MKHDCLEKSKKRLSDGTMEGTEDTVASLCNVSAQKPPMRSPPGAGILSGTCPRLIHDAAKCLVPHQGIDPQGTQLSKPAQPDTWECCLGSKLESTCIP